MISNHIFKHNRVINFFYQYEVKLIDRGSVTRSMELIEVFEDDRQARDFDLKAPSIDQNIDSMPVIDKTPQKDSCSVVNMDSDQKCRDSLTRKYQ